MSCRETKLKTLNTEPVIVRAEYAELKKILFTSRIATQEFIHGIKRGIELYSNKINLLKLETPSTSYPAHLFDIRGTRRREIFQNCSGDEVGIPCSKIPPQSQNILIPMALNLFNLPPAEDQKYKNVNLIHKLLIHHNYHLNKTNLIQILMQKLNN